MLIHNAILPYCDWEHFNIKTYDYFQKVLSII